MDHLLFETEWHTSPAVQAMQDYIRSSMTDFEGRNFTEFTDHHGFPIGSRDSHPLEAAHRAAADVIISQLGVDKIQSARVH